MDLLDEFTRSEAGEYPMAVCSGVQEDPATVQPKKTEGAEQVMKDEASVQV